MRIVSIELCNFRSYKFCKIENLGSINAFVGKNDAGKSTILEALVIFFDARYKAKESDFYQLNCTTDMYIEVHFTDYPTELDIGGQLVNLQDVGYIHSDGLLKIRRVFSKESDSGTYCIVTTDFSDPQFQNLIGKKERELNDLLDSLSLDVRKSGRGITNIAKVREIRNHLINNNSPTADDVVIKDPSKDIFTLIANSFPRILLHIRSRVEEDIQSTGIQNFFREIVDIDTNCYEQLQQIEQYAQTQLRQIFDDIKSYLETHLPDHFVSIEPQITVETKKILSVNVNIKDRYDFSTPYASRGAGTKRLIDLSVIEYIAKEKADKQAGTHKQSLILLEEPETYLHPSAQRSLASSLITISNDPDFQVFITTHSPPIVAEVPLEHIYLIKFSSKGSSVDSSVNPLTIADELGIRPSDSLVNYKLCVFVEGKSDCEILSIILKSFYSFNGDMLEKIGIIPLGGNNLHTLVSYNLLHKLHRNFILILDSDKKSKADELPQKVITARDYASQYGGECFVLRKREIENYLHPDAIIRYVRNNPNINELEQKVHGIDDYTDVKALLRDCLKLKEDSLLKLVINSFQKMTPDEFMQIQRYTDENNTEIYEFDEIVNAIRSHLDL